MMSGSGKKHQLFDNTKQITLKALQKLGNKIVSIAFTMSLFLSHATSLVLYTVRGQEW